MAICASMEYLSEQINIKANVNNMWAPIFEIKVDLIDGDLDFIPSL